jgi:hypothetical protein
MVSMQVQIPLYKKSVRERSSWGRLEIMIFLVVLSKLSVSELRYEVAIVVWGRGMPNPSALK